MCTSHTPVTPILDKLSTETHTHKAMCKNVHSCIICHSQKRETSQMSSKVEWLNCSILLKWITINTCVFFFFLWSHPTGYESSCARDWIWAPAATMPDPLTQCTGQGRTRTSAGTRAATAKFFTYCAKAGTPINIKLIANATTWMNLKNNPKWKKSNTRGYLWYDNIHKKTNGGGHLQSYLWRQG